MFQKERLDSSRREISVIIFKVGWEEFAINLLDTKEIIQAGQIRRLPKSLDFIEGIYNYRGDIIHIINLKKKLNIEEYRLYQNESKSDFIEDSSENDGKRFIIIVNLNNKNIGFYVDKIINVAHIRSKDIVRVSPIFQTSIPVNYIKGIIKFEDRPRILIDLSKIFSDAEQESIQNQLL